MRQPVLQLAIIRIGLLGVLLGLITAENVRAQSLIRSAPTDQADPRALFANPALLTFQPGVLSVGVKAYHIGISDASSFTDLRQGYLAITQPNFLRYVVGAGLGIQYFDSPIYQRMRVGVLIAARFLRYVSIGVDVGAISVSYDQNNFDLVDLNDPVFEGGTSKTALSASVGLFVHPFHFLSLAFGIRDLNNPNTSLIGGPVPSVQETYGGVAFAIGQIRTTFEIISGLRGIEGRGYIEVFSTDGSFARISSDLGINIGRAEAQLHVQGPISINYAYELPTSSLGGVSGGSHQIGFVYEFGHHAPPRFEPPPGFPLSIDQPIRQPRIVPRVYVSSDEDMVHIYEKTIVRIVSPDVPASALSALSLADIGVMDSTFTAQVRHIRTEVVALRDGIQLESSISRGYNDAIISISDKLNAREMESLSIVANPTVLGKAMGVRNRIVDEFGLPNKRVSVGVPVLSSKEDSLLYLTPIDMAALQPDTLIFWEPKGTTFLVYPTYFDASLVRSWTLTVTDLQGTVVKEIRGTTPFPKEIEWDWLDTKGKMIDAGVYYYQFSWETDSGETFTTRRSRISVLKHVRRIVIEISFDPTTVIEPGQTQRLLIRH